MSGSEASTGPLAWKYFTIHRKRSCTAYCLRYTVLFDEEEMRCLWAPMVHQKKGRCEKVSALSGEVQVIYCSICETPQPGGIALKCSIHGAKGIPFRHKWREASTSGKPILALSRCTLCRHVANAEDLRAFDERRAAMERQQENFRRLEK